MKFRLIFTFALLCLTFSACKTAEISTPTAGFKAYIEAVNKNDLPKIKQSFSRNSLKMLEETANAQKITLDEAIKNQTNPLGKTLPLPETRNEKIEGANAMLEVKTGENWDKVYFSQEDGAWKIALDKFLEEMLKEINAPK